MPGGSFNHPEMEESKDYQPQHHQGNQLVGNLAYEFTDQN